MSLKILLKYVDVGQGMERQVIGGGVSRWDHCFHAEAFLLLNCRLLLLLLSRFSSHILSFFELMYLEVDFCTQRKIQKR